MNTRARYELYDVHAYGQSHFLRGTNYAFPYASALTRIRLYPRTSVIARALPRYIQG